MPLSRFPAATRALGAACAAVLAVLALALAPLPAAAQRESKPAIGAVAPAQLPREARETMAMIRKGGPYPHQRDGIVFSNRERILPAKPRGYYREFTVRTPGEKTRGARRIVAGDAGELYYTDDHYATFRRIRE